jgi:hypothetical protein
MHRSRLAALGIGVASAGLLCCVVEAGGDFPAHAATRDDT